MGRTEAGLLEGRFSFARLRELLFGGNLPGLVSVKPEATVEQASSIMMRHDFSQLPVLHGKSDCRGAVSWTSIARARIFDPRSSLSNCITPATVVDEADDVLAHLPTIQRDDFVVLARRRLITGIITVSDVSVAFDRISGPFILIGLIETRLRDVARQHFGDTVVERPDGTSTDDVAELTIGELKSLFDRDNNWASLGWPVDGREFRGLIDDIVQWRNDVMHFRPAASDGSRTDAAHNLLTWLDYLTRGRTTSRADQRHHTSAIDASS